MLTVRRTPPDSGRTSAERSGHHHWVADCSPSLSTLTGVSDPTDDINEAFDTARKNERVHRDDSIDVEIDTTDRIANTMARDEEQ